jgi:biotin transporter BioY
MVLLQIDVPLTLVLIGIGVALSLIGVVWLTIQFKKTVRTVNSFMMSAPTVPPDTLKDLEERALAIDAFNHGDKTALQTYWKKIYEMK